MKPNRRQFNLVTLGLAGLAGLAPPAAFAQGYPDKTVRIVVGFPPGGGADFAARTISTALAKALGQSVYVENRGGANGSIGASLIAKGEPDGYSILVSTSGAIVLNPSLIKPAPYDPTTDLASVGRILTSLSTFVAHPSVPGNDMRELVDWSKKHGKPIMIASSGIGSIPHMAIELLAAVAGTEIVHVPYKGFGPALSDVMGGQMQCVVGDVPVVLPHVKSGRLRAMGVASAERSAALSNVRTLIEQGFEGTLADNWYGMFAPPGTPAAIVSRLNEALNAALRDPDVGNKIQESGARATPSSPEALADLVRTDTRKWKRLIDEKKITLSL